MMESKLQLADVQKVELEILKKVAKVCEKENIRYFLGYGTLIGAIRHNGFIPWDDDLDIIMPRPDHDRFVEYFLAHPEQFSDLKIFTPEINPEYPYMITRVSDDRYRIVMGNEKPYGMGIFIDIYPYDGMGDTWEEAISFEKKGDILSSFCYQATRKHIEKGFAKSFFMQLVKVPVFLISKAIGKNFFQKLILKNQVRKKQFDKSKYVGNAVWGISGEINTFERKIFGDYSLIEFEDARFRVPVGYDSFLRCKYGDYMQLPPEKDREPHHNYFAVRKKDYDKIC